MEHKLTDEHAARVQQFDLNVEKVEALLQRAGKSRRWFVASGAAAIAREGKWFAAKLR